MARKRRTYTPEFKTEAVKLVTEQGYSVAEAARSLASTKPSSAPGSWPSKPRASRPSPARAIRLPSRGKFAVCALKTNGSVRNVTS
jgi:transposase-like protein